MRTLPLLSQLEGRSKGLTYIVTGPTRFNHDSQPQPRSLYIRTLVKGATALSSGMATSVVWGHTIASARVIVWLLLQWCANRALDA